MTAEPTQAEVIAALISEATTNAVIVAPFITRNAFQHILEHIPNYVAVHCYTRWLPSEVAAGVSDPDIIDDIAQRPGADLRLLDRLHAKVYIADHEALVGSVNVTGRAIGISDRSNLELLVGVPSSHPAVGGLMASLEAESRYATRELADRVMAAAAAIPQSPLSDRRPNRPFIPVSPRAEAAYAVYLGDREQRGIIEIEEDLYQLDLGPGLDRTSFSATVRAALTSNPVIVQASSLPQGESLSAEDVASILERHAADGYERQDMWRALLAWINEFANDLVTAPRGDWVIKRGRKP